MKKLTIIALAIFEIAYAQYPMAVPTSVPPTPVVQVSDFTTRCINAIKCEGFDATIPTNAYGKNSGLFSPYGTTDTTKAVLDTTIKSSGNSSLKFIIPPNAGSDSSGSYFTNFSEDLLTQFGENSEFYVQWRQRFSTEFVNTNYSGAGGWKQIIIGAGDAPGKPFQSSCTALETVVQNLGQKKFPGMYNSCTGSTSHGAYNPFEEPFNGYDFKLQNARSAPYCLYSQNSSSYFPPQGNCFGYVPNEWMTFQVKIKTGPLVRDEFTNSYVTLWAAREGKASEVLINWGPYNLTAGTEGLKYGKVWLLPYNTGKNASVTYPTAYTWYDELIISRTKIADPK